MRRVVAVAAIVSLVATAVEAAPARKGCFSNADIEAAQAIEFQTQLMVISDICRDSTYGEFTQRNRDAIVAYQRQMVDHFRRAGEGNGERAFDTYITRRANEASLNSGLRTATDVCQEAAGMIATANSINGAGDFRRYIATQAAANRGNYLACSE